MVPRQGIVLAAAGRWVSKVAASAMVAAGPAMFAPQSSRIAFTDCPTSNKSSTNRIFKSVRSSDDPPVDGRRSLDEAMVSRKHLGTMLAALSLRTISPASLQLRSGEPVGAHSILRPRLEE